MKVSIVNDYIELSKNVSKFIINYVNDNPNSLLCLAGGDTPLYTYKLLIEAHLKKEVDFSKCKFVSLDEWVGLGEEDKGSCVETLHSNLYKFLNLNTEQICFFDGLTEDLEAECKRVDKFIFENKGIDIILLGVGINGHLGFNEPGVDDSLYSNVVELDSSTIKVSEKYFDKKQEVAKGITLGMKHIYEARNILLMANGEKKASIIEKTLKVEKSSMIPSTLIRDNEKTVIFLDKKAAMYLEKI